MLQTRFRLPANLREQDRRPLPVVMAIVPVIMAAVMLLVFKRWYFVIFGFCCRRCRLIGSHLYDKRAGRTSHRAMLAEYRETRAAIEADATRALQGELTARRGAFPDPDAVLRTALVPGRRLWERRRHDADALTIRVGTGDVDSEVVLDDPDQLDHKREQTWTALDVPSRCRCASAGVLGLAGREDFPRGARSVGRRPSRMVLHRSPRDVPDPCVDRRARFVASRSGEAALDPSPHGRPAARLAR